jgi:aldose 1-epimerase
MHPAFTRVASDGEEMRRGLMKKGAGAMFQRKEVCGALLGMLLMLMCAGCTGSRKEGGAMQYSAKQLDVEVGGQRVVELARAHDGQGSRAEIISVELLPGRGMNVYQMRAYIPGRGVVEMLTSPDLERAREMMVGGPDEIAANRTHGAGGPLLLPWANRIRGKATADGQAIEAAILGRTVLLPANNTGRGPDGERHSIHGLMMARGMDEVSTIAGARQAAATAILSAGDFNGRWLSRTRLEFQAVLHEGRFALDVTASNTGSEPLPMGIGWHPFFAIPSGQREQVRLRIPATHRALVNSYLDVFPTGEVEPVAGTAYDFTARGAELGERMLDDCFIELQRDGQGHATAEMIDAAAGYGLRVRALSPEIRAFQVFSPTTRPVVAIEPQFNYADPFSKAWGGVNTGMVVLQPGERVTYSVEVEVFQP